MLEKFSFVLVLALRETVVLLANDLFMSEMSLWSCRHLKHPNPFIILDSRKTFMLQNSLERIGKNYYYFFNDFSKHLNRAYLENMFLVLQTLQVLSKAWILMPLHLLVFQHFLLCLVRIFQHHDLFLVVFYFLIFVLDFTVSHQLLDRKRDNMKNIYAKRNV